MENNQQYNIEKLEWQQFEILSFKCLQLDVSGALNFIEGGSDKGRDFVFEGKSEFFGYGDFEHRYIFQAKHKSKKGSFKSLNNDLKIELEKVFIKNSLDYSFYCLVTNITLTGNEHDVLNQTFDSFLSKNNISKEIKFGVYSYRNLEACIDKNDFLKWVFPSIICNTDFKYLLEEITEKNEKNISKGWLSVFEKNKINFVYTNIYEKALVKLKDKNVLLLSGPSKSGKTFNAEMLLFNSFCNNSFTPYKIDKIDEFDRFYDRSKKQIFLFDDAFGKYNIDAYRADSFNRKLEYIFESIDENHKCIFTSREYIYKAFLGYTDEIVKDFITKITIEVNDLTKGEKESIFLRYYKCLSNDALTLSTKQLDKILFHKNFSPETVRAYFTASNVFELGSFIKHLESPDGYLEKDFNNLSDEKKIILISTLLSLKGTVSSISYSYEKICDDLNKQFLISINDILNQLDGSILKSVDSEYIFYHPSMFEFFVRYISKDTSIYKRLLLINFNIRLLNVIRFKPGINEDAIKINKDDLSLLIEGFSRLLNNPDLSLIELNSIFSWISNSDVQLNLKIHMRNKYIEFKSKMDSLITNLNHETFLNQNIYHLADFFKNISFNHREIKIKNAFFEKLIETRKYDENYWVLVFRIIPLLEKDFIFKNIPREWFQEFLKEMRDEINSLGFELYGNAYPKFVDVRKYKKLMEEKKFDEAQAMKKKQRADFMKKTNKKWYPRYLRCKEKMNVLKTSQPYGYKLYELLIPNFSHLQRLEDNQFNRYIFNKEQKWW
ncbi:hypothetical protein [Marinifilum flexuosum]|uniref:nSTAND3 domain-containing NTPase n=1 Tax=Marinifilum flexuosum TaxID=1117708 RepID=UPI002494ECDE|nr:hypothetical protein [Marinifilum flexuosum]